MQLASDHDSLVMGMGMAEEEAHGSERSEAHAVSEDSKGFEGKATRSS